MQFLEAKFARCQMQFPEGEAVFCPTSFLAMYSGKFTRMLPCVLHTAAGVCLSLLCCEVWAGETDESGFTVGADAQPFLTQGWAGPELGRILSESAVDDLPRHVFADGRGLPPGEGNARDGAILYAGLCAECHGSEGQGGRALELVGDRSLLDTEYPDRGLAVFWPDAPTLYEYIYRAMPPEQPASLQPDELYAILAHLLELNGLLDPGVVLDKRSLSNILMPNRYGFRTIKR